jgi:hypothetical protein
MMRSVLAVVAGYVVVLIATMGLVAGIAAVSPSSFPQPGEMRAPSVPIQVIILAAGFAFAVVGGFIAALVAPRSPALHALALGLLMTVLGVISMVMITNAEPRWFQIGLIMIPIPGTWLGGRLRGGPVVDPVVERSSAGPSS